MAIENGGDDYITKPFHLDIVMAKVKSALRRGYGEYASAAESDCLGVNGLLLFPSQHVVEWQGQQTELTKNEFYLLECLMKQANQYVTREELLEALWDEVAFVDDNTLTVNVKRVRKKLEELGIKNAIVTKRGYGYALLTEWEKDMKVKDYLMDRFSLILSYIVSLCLFGLVLQLQSLLEKRSIDWNTWLYGLFIRDSCFYCISHLRLPKTECVFKED